MVGHDASWDFLFAPCVAVDDRMPLVRRVASNREVVLMIAELGTIGIVLLEAVTGDGGNDADPRGVRWNGEGSFPFVEGWVVVTPVELTSSEGEGR